MGVMRYTTTSSDFMKQRFLCLFIAAVVLGFFGMSGCGGSRKVIREESVTSRTSGGTAAEGESVKAGKARTTVEERETRTEYRSESQGGILTMTFHFIGEVLAFPFQLIANVFRTIF
ncbi:MAG: hypothetical protein NTZ78_00800 [Candidatus Aureabacteria bacterium]|nr:hypothetical protein [Candidatus Auribacterota bacterium]